MNKVRTTNYLAIDLEMNKDSNDNITKIIQVGVAVGNPHHPEDIKSYSWYVDPNELISPYITNLTGITDDIIKNHSTSLTEIADNIQSIVSEYNVFVNPVQWGLGDAEMLLEEFRKNKIEARFFGRRVIDVKMIHLFLEVSNGRSPSGGLGSAMGKYKIKFEGLPHRADVDAYNTLRFFFYLISRQATLEDTISTMKSIKY